MKNLITTAAAITATATAASAAGNNITYFPGDGITSTTAPLGVAGDAAPGFGTGSFAANGATKSAIQFTPQQLFGRNITVDEIASMSYYTKQDGPFTTSPTYVNWYLELYTTPDGNDDDAWYGRRLNMEPYFTPSPDAPAGEWAQWSTDAGDNQLRVFDANRGASGPVFGTYQDPFWNDITAGAVDWNSFSGLYDNTPVDYRNETVWFWGISTGSGWANGFTGQVDGVRIELTNGEVGTVNFEIPAPGTAGALALAGFAATRRRR